jgi:hypothetical protein
LVGDFNGMAVTGAVNLDTRFFKDDGADMVERSRSDVYTRPQALAEMSEERQERVRVVIRNMYILFADKSFTADQAEWTLDNMGFTLEILGRGLPFLQARTFARATTHPRAACAHA